MPFTPTHALAAVALCRLKRLNPLALAIGTMVPDVPMFYGWTPSYETTHSAVWGVPACMPYALVAFALVRLCRGAAIGMMPTAARSRLIAVLGARPEPASRCMGHGRDFDRAWSSDPRRPPPATGLTRRWLTIALAVLIPAVAAASSCYDYESPEGLLYGFLTRTIAGGLVGMAALTLPLRSRQARSSA